MESALEHAHQKGVIHRDVRPANIVYSMNRAEGMKVYLIDFGLAEDEGSCRGGQH